MVIDSVVARDGAARRAARRVRRTLRDERALWDLTRLPFLDRAAVRRARTELRRGGLLDWIVERQAAFARSERGSTARGARYDFGAMLPTAAERLYAVLRATRPDTVVETGVCNGVSTAVILAALDANGAGRLRSLDWPEFTDTVHAPDEFWSGKGGSVVPRGEQPGWLVPERLRGRWRLEIGRSQDRLPSLIAESAPLDVFIHDSEHSYECMRDEFATAWPALRPGGLLVSDDTSWNEAFAEFAVAAGVPQVRVAGDTRLLVKP